MKISINGKNKFEVKPKLREHITQKVESLSSLFHSREDLSPKVVCKEYGSLKVVEVTIPTKHLIFRAEAQAEDMFVSVDLACEKIEKQIIRHKQKINSIIRKREGISNYFSGMIAQDQQKENKLVKSKDLELTVMSVDDAILQLELLGHDFYMFINEEDHKVSTVYLRNDGDYAIIKISK